MNLFSQTVIRSLTYAGIFSNGLAILVFIVCHATEHVPTAAIDLSIWIATYLFHKRMGTW